MQLQYLSCWSNVALNWQAVYLLDPVKETLSALEWCGSRERIVASLRTHERVPFSPNICIFRC